MFTRLQEETFQFNFSTFLLSEFANTLYNSGIIETKNTTGPQLYNAGIIECQETVDRFSRADLLQGFPHMTASSNGTQKRISIMSNSGGVGKTTLAVNLAYQFARTGKSVVLLGCDPNGSLTLFCGLDDPLNDNQTLDAVLRSDFAGQYPLYPVWADKINGVDACLGGLVLSKTATRLVNETRGDYLLADKLEDYPLTHDIIILDCPGTIEQMHTVALAASTHVLLTIKPEDKDIDAVAKLIEWFYEKRDALRLRPAPEIIGIVPNGFKDRAMHRDNLGSGSEGPNLYSIMKNLGITVFPIIKDLAHIANAGANGLPLGLFRPGEETNKTYKQIAESVIKEG